MKKQLLLLALLLVMGLPWACSNRALTQPVDPIPTATPTRSPNSGTVYPTPTP